MHFIEAPVDETYFQRKLRVSLKQLKGTLKNYKRACATITTEDTAPAHQLRQKNRAVAVQETWKRLRILNSQFRGMTGRDLYDNRELAKLLGPLPPAQQSATPNSAAGT